VDWPLLDDLSDAERRDMLTLARRRKFKKNDIIFHEGDPSDTLHLVARGHVAIRIHTPVGDVATVRVLRPGEFFGELAVVAPAPRNATAVALDVTETLSLTRDHFTQLRSDHPDIDRVLINALVSEVRRLASRLVDAMYLPTEQRVWRNLRELADAFDDGTATIVRIPVTQEVVAQLAGCTRPTVNQMMRGATDIGVIEVGRGWIDVLDREALAQRA
jgi:CRP/FNR family transcriptional regulator, cyclic AMP receptor protein